MTTTMDDMIRFHSAFRDCKWTVPLATWLARTPTVQEYEDMARLNQNPNDDEYFSGVMGMKRDGKAASSDAMIEGSGIPLC